MTATFPRGRCAQGLRWRSGSFPPTPSPSQGAEPAQAALGTWSALYEAVLGPNYRQIVKENQDLDFDVPEAKLPQEMREVV